MDVSSSNGLERNFSLEGDNHTDGQAGLISPQGGEALPRLVNRTVEVNQEQWLALHKSSLSTAVQDKSEKQGKILKVIKRSTRRHLFWHNGLPIINPYTQIYAWWCAYLLFMDGTYTAFVVPIGVGFNTSSVQWNWVGYWDFIAGVTFAAELIMSWNVAFVATRNLRKRIVLKRRNIAHFYIWHGTFIFDTISTLVFIIQCVGYGLGSAGSSTGSIIQIIQILRALRLLRLLKLLQQLFVMSLTAPQTKVPLINKTVPVWASYLLQLGYIVGLFINFLACVWVFVAYRASRNDTWINNYSPFVSAWSSDPNAETLTEAEVDLIPGPDIYLAAAYWSLTAITTIGFGDITPISNAERAVMLLVEVLGVLFFGILLGSITSLLQRASQEVKEAQMFREKMGHVSEWMARAKLPRNVKEKIRAYYAQVWVRQKVEENDLSLFVELPQHLRAAVAWHWNKPVLDKVHIFKDLTEEIQYMIAGRAKPSKVPPGHEVCAQGDPAECIWLLHEGEVVAVYHYQEGEVEKAPAIVGETALLAGSEGQYSVRPCGYRTLTACVLWEISMQDLQPIVDWQEHVADMLESRAREHVRERQAEHPHLWGFNSSDFKDNGQGENKGDDATEQADVSEDDGESIDIRSHSGGKDGTGESHPSDKEGSGVDHPSSTLKHPRRSARRFTHSSSQGGQSSQPEDRALGASNSLMKQSTSTSPDDNHVVINMPVAGSTKPASHARRSLGSSDSGNHAAPSDSAYSADAMPPFQTSQQNPGADAHDSSPEQWQQQQQRLGRQSGHDRHQHTQSDMSPHHAGSEHQVAGPENVSSRSTSVQQQQVHEQMRQQQQVARSSRSYTDMPRTHLQKRPGHKQPENESQSEPSHDRGALSVVVDPSEAQGSLQTASQTASDHASAQGDESEVGHGPQLAGGAVTHDHQLNALHEQLRGLMQASQGMGESLLRVHQQIEALKSV